jgi:hypothetical protein
MISVLFYTGLAPCHVVSENSLKFVSTNGTERTMILILVQSASTQNSMALRLKHRTSVFYLCAGAGSFPGKFSAVRAVEYAKHLKRSLCTFCFLSIFSFY